MCGAGEEEGNEASDTKGSGETTESAKDIKAPPVYRADRYKGCGLDNVYLEGGVEYIQTPRGWVLHIQDVEGLHRAIGHWLVHEKKI